MDSVYYRKKHLINESGLGGWIQQAVILLLLVVANNPAWSASSIVWWGCVGLFLMTMMLKSRTLVVYRTYFLWTMAFVVFCCCSIIWAKSFDLVLTAMKSKIVHIVVFYFLLSRIRTTQDILVVLKLFVFSCLINAAYLFLSNSDLLLSVSQGKTEYILFAQSDGWNPNNVGMMSAFATIILLWFLRKSISWKEKLFYSISIVFLVIISLITGSRKALIMVVAGIMLYLLLTSKGKRIKMLLAIGVIACVAYYLVMEVPFFYAAVGYRMEAFLSQWTGKGALDNSSILRQRFIGAAIDVWSDYPVMGCGIDCFRIMNGSITGYDWYAHNNFVELLADVGIVGFSIYYGGYAYMLVNLFRRRNRQSISVVFLVVLIIELIAEYAYVSYNDFVAGFLLMLMFAYIGIERTEIVTYD